ncbi:MAG: hypothetical protein ACK4GO_15410 [Gemmobacter sp.]
MGHHTTMQADQGAAAGVAPPIGRAQAEAARAVLSVVLIAVAPQGAAEARALSRAAAVCIDSAVFDGLDAVALRDLGRVVLRGLSARGPGPVMADVQGHLPQRLVETALCLAIRAARNEGAMPPGAMDRLGALSMRLGVEVDRFAAMVEVLEILDRRPD